MANVSNHYRIPLDLRLTTQEFEGLVFVLNWAVLQVRSHQQENRLHALSEDTLLLAGYATAITPARITLWKTRRMKPGAKRYIYLGDLLLVKALLRILPTSRVNTETQALLSRMHQLMTDLTRQPLSASTTGLQAGIVEAQPRQLPT